MAPIPIWTGHVDADGTVHLDNPPVFAAYKKRLKGQAIELVLRPQRTKRSLDQNAYWWGVVVKIVADFMGEAQDATHYALLGECWGYHPSEINGREVPNKGSSRNLTTDEFSYMIEWVGPWAMEKFGVQIPLPGEAE